MLCFPGVIAIIASSYIISTLPTTMVNVALLFTKYHNLSQATDPWGWSRWKCFWGGARPRTWSSMIRLALSPPHHPSFRTADQIGKRAWETRFSFRDVLHTAGTSHIVFMCVCFDIVVVTFVDRYCFCVSFKWRFSFILKLLRCWCALR